MPNLSIRPHVLCVSRDKFLCATRRMILATRYETLCVGSVDEMQVLPGGQEIEVVLLCHSLSPDESRRAVWIARERWPGAKIVALSIEPGGFSEYTDQVVRGLDGPRELLLTIGHVLPVAC